MFLGFMVCFGRRRVLVSMACLEEKGSGEKGKRSPEVSCF
jgi:hypothetical protein